MKLTYPEYDLELELQENKISVLVVENHAVLTELVQELYRQSNGSEGKFVLSEENKMLQFDKCVNLMTDMFSLNCNERKIISKLYQEMEELAFENLLQEGMEVSREISSYMEKMCEQVPYQLCYGAQIMPSMLMKMLDLKFETETETLLERVIEYLGIVNKIFKYKINIFVHLKLFLTAEELQNLYEYAFYNKIPLLLVEGVAGEQLYQEETIVIDVDKCTIKM